jgi:hypothetical protein
MKWLYVTIAVLAASACLIAWIYLRDRDTSTSPPSASQLARNDAAETIIASGDADCRKDCAAKVLGHSGHRWLVRIIVKGRSQCLQIDLETFGESRGRGLSGVWPSPCVIAILHRQIPYI